MGSLTGCCVRSQSFQFPFHVTRLCRTEHGHTSCCFIHCSPVLLPQSPQTNNPQQVSALAKCSALPSSSRIGNTCRYQKKCPNAICFLKWCPFTSEEGRIWRKAYEKKKFNFYFTKGGFQYMKRHKLKSKRRHAEERIKQSEARRHLFCVQCSMNKNPTTSITYNPQHRVTFPFLEVHELRSPLPCSNLFVVSISLKNWCHL
jgi:hypothetical protein